MAILTSPSFPIRPSDQADVMRIFLELMEERYPSRPANVTSDRSTAYRSGSPRVWFPGDLPDPD